MRWLAMSIQHLAEIKAESMHVVLQDQPFVRQMLQAGLGKAISSSAAECSLLLQWHVLDYASQPLSISTHRG